jgi:hypothetical protein
MISSMAPIAFADNEAVFTSAGNTATIHQDVEICGDVDLTFAIDTTGSMVNALANVKANLPAIIAQADLVDDDGQARVGVISFDGFDTVNPTGDYVNVHNDLSAPRATAVANINALAIGFGGGGPEANGEAKKTAITNRAAGNYADVDGVVGPQIGSFTAPWTADQKILILVTDNRNGGFGDATSANRDAQMGTLGTLAAANGIKVGDVNVAAVEDPLVKAGMLADATNSGGLYAFDANGLNTAQVIIDIIAELPCPVVGGQMMPIDSTALFVAGAGANAFWLLPLLGAVAGTGIYVARNKFQRMD